MQEHSDNRKDSVSHGSLNMATPDKKKRVLIIDDDYKSRRLLESHLVSMGFDPVFAKDSEEALKVFSQDPSFSLIITDMMSPYSSTSEFAKILKLQQQTRVIPVIGTSSLYSLIQSKNIDRSAYNGFLPKPVTRNILKNEIKKIIKDWVAT
jgi:PleD family two-component response regulator